jgi:hypothetical protein
MAHNALRWRVADCKSTTVSSTLTGASLKNPVNSRTERAFRGFFVRCLTGAKLAQSLRLGRIWHPDAHRTRTSWLAIAQRVFRADVSREPHSSGGGSRKAAALRQDAH